MVAAEIPEGTVTVLFTDLVDETEIIEGWAPGGLDLLGQIILLPGLETDRREPAGKIMQYSNVNYSLVGEIIRRTTGDSLDVATRRFVFEPVAMADSAVIVPDD